MPDSDTDQLRFAGFVVSSPYGPSIAHPPMRTSAHVPARRPLTWEDVLDGRASPTCCTSPYRRCSNTHGADCCRGTSSDGGGCSCATRSRRLCGADRWPAREQRLASPPSSGRWQRGEAVAALYLADEEPTAWAEWYRVLAELALSPTHGMPRDLWCWTVAVNDIADLLTEAKLARLDLPCLHRAGGHGRRSKLLGRSCIARATAVCSTRVPPARSTKRFASSGRQSQSLAISMVESAFVTPQ